MPNLLCHCTIHSVGFRMQCSKSDHTNTQLCRWSMFLSTMCCRGLPAMLYTWRPCLWVSIPWWWCTGWQWLWFLSVQCWVQPCSSQPQPESCAEPNTRSAVCTKQGTMMKKASLHITNCPCNLKNLTRWYKHTVWVPVVAMTNFFVVKRCFP